MIRQMVTAAALCALFGVASMAGAKRADIRPGQVWGLGSTGCPEEHCDDFIGFPIERKDELRAMSGANLGGGNVVWGECEKEDPGDGRSQYDWSSLDSNTAANDPRYTLMIGVKLGNKWADPLHATDRERYYRLFERFVEAAARECRRRWGDRAKYYHAPGNEPSLRDAKSFPPGYFWNTWYMEQAIHIYDAIKRASPENQLVVGALVVGDEERIGRLYEAGLKGHFDVLDIHAYAPGEYEIGHKMHVGIDQIIEAHRVLEKRGDGDKKIFLGEGWSLWPKPEPLYRESPDEPVTPEMIEHYRQALLCGYRNLTTPREGFDPDWVLGARYFILNDFWGQMHWKERAIPRYNDKGKLEGWVLDGYWLPYEKDKLEPKYRDWGVVNFDGTLKSPELLIDFPPYIPKAEIVGSIHLPPGEATAAPGQSYRVTVRATNGEQSAFTDVRFGLHMRKWWNDKKSPAPEITELSENTPTTIAPGRSVSHDFQVEFVDKHRGKSIRLIGEFNYTWEGKPYYADAWIWVNVK